MSFHRITHHEKLQFATLHNFGCTFRCAVCSYKLRSGAEGKPGLTFPKPEKFLSVAQMKNALFSVPLKTVYFMGGEPTVAPELQEMLDFCKNTLHVRTMLGHTNGSKLPLPNLDGANVGIKAWDEKIHEAYTGKPKRLIFDNFARAVDAGMQMRANVVFVPGLVDLDQVEAIAQWLATLSKEIPMHIMGYIPVPGQTHPRPTSEQMNQSVALCKKHLRTVGFSHLSPEQALHLERDDERFRVKQIA